MTSQNAKLENSKCKIRKAKSQISNLKSQNDILFLSLRGGPPKAGRRGNLKIAVIGGKEIASSVASLLPRNDKGKESLHLG